jgi:hypothetical protein
MPGKNRAARIAATGKGCWRRPRRCPAKYKIIVLFQCSNPLVAMARNWH